MQRKSSSLLAVWGLPWWAVIVGVILALSAKMTPTYNFFHGNSQ